MKKLAVLKYPNSASLFRLCRRVLEQKLSSSRIHDHDIGKLLNFDPADCSHWKNGHKNIVSLLAIRSLSRQLEIDEKILIDLVHGDLDEDEAFFEYLGYGRLSLDESFLTKAKKAFYKNHKLPWSRERDIEFQKFFQIDEKKISQLTYEVIQKSSCNKIPIHIPELISFFPEIIFNPIPQMKENITYKRNAQQFIINFKSGTENKLYSRFELAKILGSYFLNPKKDPSREFLNYRVEINEIEKTLFAFHLLVPTHYLTREMEKLDNTKDIVLQLSETFWVSRNFMNARLQNFLKEKKLPSTFSSDLTLPVREWKEPHSELAPLL